MNASVRGVPGRRGCARGGGLHPILWTVVLVAGTCLCACGLVGPDESSKCGVVAPALINGSDEPGGVQVSVEERHAIVAIEDSAGALRCTGTVVQDGLIMTAARCLEGAHVAARFDSGDVIPLEVVVAEQAGVVLLDHPARPLPEGVRPLPLWLFDIPRGLVGHTVTLAGFGVTETQELGSLRFLDEPISRVTAAQIEVDGMGSRGACAGDLGAPLMMGVRGGPEVAGVLVQVSASCTGVDVYQRIDQIVEELDRLYGDDAGQYEDLGGC